jgi:uncharacterized protein YoxC
MWFALGTAALLAALGLLAALLRLRRTLGALERTLETADETMRVLVPEVHSSLGNVNDIAAGVNVALRTAGSGATKVSTGLGERAGEAKKDAAAAAYGTGVGMRAFLRSLSYRRH